MHRNGDEVIIRTKNHARGIVVDANPAIDRYTVRPYGDGLVLVAGHELDPVDDDGCPCCGAPPTKWDPDVDTMGTIVYCSKCGAMFTAPGETIYRGDSYNYVSPMMSRRTDMDGAKYFDLMVLGSNGVERRHGWFDPDTKLILQIG